MAAPFWQLGEDDARVQDFVAGFDQYMQSIGLGGMQGYGPQPQQPRAGGIPIPEPIPQPMPGQGVMLAPGQANPVPQQMQQQADNRRRRQQGLAGLGQLIDQASSAFDQRLTGVVPPRGGPVNFQPQLTPGLAGLQSMLARASSRRF